MDKDICYFDGEALYSEAWPSASRTTFGNVLHSQFYKVTQRGFNELFLVHGPLKAVRDD